jgi:hypothetical protein
MLCLSGCYFGFPSGEKQDASSAGVWTAIASWEGQGTKSTEAFQTLTDEWRIKWQTKDIMREAGIPGIFSIMVYDSKKSDFMVDLAANVTGESDSMSYVRCKPGSYYLQIVGANCKWDVTVEERR